MMVGPGWEKQLVRVKDNFKEGIASEKIRSEISLRLNNKVM